MWFQRKSRPVQIGDVIAGKYRVERTLGTGGMGVVVAARHVGLDEMRASREVDARADVWALGVILYELVTGTQPFPGNTYAEVASQVLKEHPPPPSSLRQEVPRDLERVILRCLDKDRNRRMPGAEELMRALLPFVPASLPEKPHVVPPPESSVTHQRQDAGAEDSPLEFCDTAPVDDPAPGQATAHKPWREPVTGMSFVWVPPGRFLMGSSTDPATSGYDPDAYEDETPAHEVELPDGIWMGEHPVTNAQYGAFLAGAKYKEPKHWENRRFNAAEQPVVGISFEDALAFCTWLTKRVGQHEGYWFDLPTEAEWEYAARGLDGRKYPWGNDDPAPAQACFGQPWATGAPATVGGRPAGSSPFGCQDMVGTVWEWCQDLWQEGYDHMMTKSVDPRHRGNHDHGAPRVVRGGSWLNLAWGIRCAVREGNHPGQRRDFLGFRVVRRGSLQPW